MIKRFEQFISESVTENEFKEYFLSLSNGCSIRWIDDSSIFYEKDGKLLLNYDKVSGIIWYSRQSIFIKLESEFGYNVDKINELITSILIKRFNSSDLLASL